MTTKRDSESKAEKAKRPKVKKEKLKDLRPDRDSDAIKGGAGNWADSQHTFCRCP